VLRRAKKRRTLVLWLFIIAGIIVAFQILSSYHGIWRHWLIAGIALLCCTPVILWDTFLPPVVELTAFSKTVDYEFRDHEYAYEFADLNDEHVLSIA